MTADDPRRFTMLVLGLVSTAILAAGAALALTPVGGGCGSAFTVTPTATTATQGACEQRRGEHRPAAVALLVAGGWLGVGTVLIFRDPLTRRVRP